MMEKHVNLHFNNDNDFAVFKKQISGRLKNREKKKAFSEGSVPSAVLMLIMNRDNEAHVLLTKRTDRVRTHKGQVSFPGGAMEKSDNSILDTAVRETFEETGIGPSDIEILGEFDETISITNFHVSTFIGALNYPYSCRMDTGEIEACFDAPLSIFCNKEYTNIETYIYEGSPRTVYHYLHEGFDIWGMTAGILTNFAESILKG
jgi:8-oxo-dGTP pyrophosphatase MutT (NUDIX family)